MNAVASEWSYDKPWKIETNCCGKSLTDGINFNAQNLLDSPDSQEIILARLTQRQFDSHGP